MCTGHEPGHFWLCFSATVREPIATWETCGFEETNAVITTNTFALFVRQRQTGRTCCTRTMLNLDKISTRKINNHAPPSPQSRTILNLDTINTREITNPAPTCPQSRTILNLDKIGIRKISNHATVPRPRIRMHTYLTQSLYEVNLQKPTPPKIRRLNLCHY